MNTSQNPKIAIISVVVRVLDRQELIASGKDLGVKAITPEKALFALMTNVHMPLAEAGVQHQASLVTQVADDQYRLDYAAVVIDGQLLAEAAHEAYQASYFGELAKDVYQDISDSDYLYEYLVASNNSPSPVDCGYEIVRRDA